MLKRTTHTRKCLVCKDKFEPRNGNQLVCDFMCAKLYAQKQEAKRKKEEKQVLMEKLKTRSEHLKDLQKVFNQFIRIRDKSQPCISCGTTKKHIQYHAGHYKSCGAYPSLRFTEDNCHKQCSTCNNILSGNIHEYRKNLIARIGVERVEALEQVGTEPLKLAIYEIQAMKEVYKNKIKQLKQHAH